MSTPLVGTVHPVLADIMGRVTWFPFLFALWTDHWEWASLIMMVYHYVIYLPLREISNPALPAAQTFPSLEDDATARQMYMVMALVGIAAAAVGAVVRRMERVPFHFVPISHLVRTIWPIHAVALAESDQPMLTRAQQKNAERETQGLPPISKRYTIYITIAFVLAVGGSLMAQEIYAWVHGGGDHVWDWVLAFLPTAVTILVLIPSLFFDPEETFAISGWGPAVRTRALIAAAKIVVPTLLVTAVPQIVALYVRNMNVVILSGSMLIVGVLLISVILAFTLFVETPEVYRGKPPAQAVRRDERSIL